MTITTRDRDHLRGSGPCAGSNLFRTEPRWSSGIFRSRLNNGSSPGSGAPHPSPLTPIHNASAGSIVRVFWASSPPSPRLWISKSFWAPARNTLCYPELVTKPPLVHQPSVLSREMYFLVLLLSSLAFIRSTTAATAEEWRSRSIYQCVSNIVAAIQLF